MKTLQGKRSVKHRMGSSYNLLVERGRKTSHQALTKVCIDSTLFVEEVRLTLFQLKSDLDKLSSEVTELENTLVSLYEEASQRGDKYADMRLQPAVLVNVGGDTRLVVVDSVWSELIAPTGFPNCTVSTNIGSRDPAVVDIGKQVGYVSLYILDILIYASSFGKLLIET